MSSLNSIDTIKNFLDLRQGIQRANRYSVKINKSTGEGNVETVTVYPSAVSFGARATNYVYDGLQGYGYGRAVPNSTSYVGGVVLTFLVTGDLFILNYFNDWFDSLYKNELTGTSKFVVPYYDNAVYNSSMNIDFLDLNGNLSPGTSSWLFTEVYPVESMPIEMSAKPDSPLLYQVVLRYRTIKRSAVAG